MDAAIRKKRSKEGSRRSELEAQLAELRDQEAELVRAIELVLEYESTGKGIGDVGTPILTERPTAEEKDYELKLKHVTEAHKRRNKLFWADVRKVITSLLSHKPVKSVFGVSVRETPWGIVPKNWEQYTSIISKPMDLNTVKQKLGDEDRSPQYKSPHEVAEDVRLIVDNCLTFNSDPQNEPVRKIADQLNQMFDKKWRDGSFDQRWQKDRAQEQMDYEELSDLQAAAKGTTADKIRYFDNCVRRRLQDLQTGEPKPGKPFTWEQKRKLSLACSKLSDEHCQSLMDIIAKSSDVPQAQDGEMVLDIGSLPDSVLYSMQKFVDCVPKNEVHARAMGPSAPAARLQPASEAPTAPLASAAAPVMAKAEAVTVEKAEPATVAPDVAAPAVASPAVASPAVASPAVAASADERGGDAAALASPTDAGDNEQPKAVDTLREGGDAEQPRQNSGEPAANGRAEPQASTGVSGGSRDSSSSSSDASSSSSDDKSDRSSNSSGQGKNKSPDSQQDESNHGPGSGKGSIEDNEKPTSGDVGETVLVSRNVPIGGEKAAPAILKAKDDAKEIQIENEDDWAVPADDDENDEAQAMDAEDTPQADTADDCKTRPEEDADGI